VAVEDVVRVLSAAALGDPRLRDRTVAVVGPETLDLREIVRRVGSVVGRRPTCVRLPVAAHLALAWVAEQTMRVPLIARAQVRILAEGATDAAPFGDPPPIDLQPAVRFEATAIRAGLPPDGRGFTHRDLRWCGT
jgi:NADH dehydrogenase